MSTGIDTPKKFLFASDESSSDWVNSKTTQGINEFARKVNFQVEVNTATGVNCVTRIARSGFNNNPDNRCELSLKAGDRLKLTGFHFTQYLEPVWVFCFSSFVPRVTISGKPPKGQCDPNTVKFVYMTGKVMCSALNASVVGKLESLLVEIEMKYSLRRKGGLANIGLTEDQELWGEWA